MTSVNFPEANATFKAPPGLDEKQVHTCHAFLGQVNGGSMDGTQMVVVAWKPSREEALKIRSGKPIFLTVMGGLPPHMLTTSFKEATNPA